MGWVGELRFRGLKYKVSNALMYFGVAVCVPPESDVVSDVFFAHHCCLHIDLRTQAQS